MRKSLKKVLATGLAATMALSMTACNNGGSGNNTTTQGNNDTPAQTSQ